MICEFEINIVFIGFNQFKAKEKPADNKKIRYGKPGQFIYHKFQCTAGREAMNEDYKKDSYISEGIYTIYSLCHTSGLI